MEVLPKLSPIASVQLAHARDVAEPGDPITMYIVLILCVNVSVDATPAGWCHRYHKYRKLYHRVGNFGKGLIFTFLLVCAHS